MRRDLRTSEVLRGLRMCYVVCLGVVLEMIYSNVDSLHLNDLTGRGQEGNEY